MTVQEACLVMQGIAHDGHAQEEVLVLSGGRKIPVRKIYRDGNRIVIQACCGRCMGAEHEGK